MGQITPQVFERGDKIYLVAPVSPFTPDEAAIEQFAFADELRGSAPNPHFLWLRGNYVEADNANSNGDEWTANELAIKALTPMYCPVTVMHDPTTAVGLIADTRLLTPENDQVPRARIETTLAIWSHRFPDTAEEIAHNYEQGMLMQSMECFSPYYSCKACGRTFQRLPHGAEKSNHCAHLAESPNASRILGGVTFSGTGLIFGSRGAKGAYSDANLEVFHEEVVAAHQEAHQAKPSGKRTRRRTPMETIEISREEYDSLKARPTQEALAAETKRANDAEAAKADADRAVEAAEAAQSKAEAAQRTAESKVEDFEEGQRQEKMASERLDALGKGFKAAMGERTAARVKKDAGEMTDEVWADRVAELEEMLAKKADDPGDGTGGGEHAAGGETFTETEISASHIASPNGGDGGDEPSEEARDAVMGNLLG